MRTHSLTRHTAVLMGLMSLARPALAQEEIKATETDPQPDTAPATADAAKTETSAAAASAPLGLAIAAKIGGTVPTSDLGLTYYAALEVQYDLPVLDGLLGIAVEFSAGQPSTSGTVNAAQVGGNFDYDLSTRVIVIGVEAIASKSFGDISPYGGVGYGFYFLHANVEAFGDTNTEDQMRSGLQIRGGAGYRLGPGEVVAELRYHYVQLRFLSTGKSNAGGITLGVGYKFSF